MFDLESAAMMRYDEFKSEFHLEKAHLSLLTEVLQIPPMFKSPQGNLVDGMEALCML